jgi:hypothetical protein
MNKAAIKEKLIKYWFMKRRLLAIEEYREAVKDTPYEFYCVSYRGNTFNPLELKPKEMKGFYEVPPDSTYADALDRYIRLMDDQQKVATTLTYILNFVDTEAEFKYVVFNEDGHKLTTTFRLDEFKEKNQDKLSFLRRIRLMSDMVK